MRKYYIHAMNFKPVYPIVIGILLCAVYVLPSCNSKKTESTVAKTDTTATSTTPVNTINLPHADTSLIPILAKVIDDALDASAKKDYNRLGSLIIYIGPDMNRLARDVYRPKNPYEKNVMRITGDVFNKWNRDIESKDYTRVFEMDQPNGVKMPVLEVLFVSKKSVDRKFFGFLNTANGYKILDVTTHI